MANTLELFRFADRVQSVTLRVACDAPMMTGDERCYAAEIAVGSRFVNGGGHPAEQGQQDAGGALGGGEGSSNAKSVPTGSRADRRACPPEWILVGAAQAVGGGSNGDSVMSVVSGRTPALRPSAR